jgi:hypothetical protein
MTDPSQLMGDAVSKLITRLPVLEAPTVIVAIQKASKFTQPITLRNPTILLAVMRITLC